MSNLIDRTLYKQHINKVNSAFKKVRKSNASLFETVRNAYDLLAKDWKKDWQRFKLDVDCDTSTFNKIVKIVETDFVMKNLERLPVAWSVLYAIALKTKDHLDDLQTALDNEELTNKTTLKELNSLVKVESNAVKTTENVLRFDSSAYDAAELDELLEITRLLEEKFRIQVRDVAKRTEEVCDVCDSAPCECGGH